LTHHALQVKENAPSLEEVPSNVHVPAKEPAAAAGKRLMQVVDLTNDNEPASKRQRV